MAALLLEIPKAIDTRLDKLAAEIEAYAKDNAPWDDRTGDAREGLTAEAYHDGSKHGVVLYHTVDYGIWLEIRWSGTYAIILPTIEHFAGQVFDGIDLGPGGLGDDVGEGD